MQSYEINARINEVKRKFEAIEDMTDISGLKATLESAEKEMASPSVWNDQERATRLGQEAQYIRERLATLEDIRKTIDDLDAAVELSEEDETFAGSLEDLIREAESKIRDLELKTLLSGEYDAKNAYLSVHPGAGGTESQDWASMLLRMYERWAEKKGYKLNYVEENPGEEAGIKSATINIRGPFAYGMLKHETGVHRLVRISPFDSNHRRHTSFASVTVFPETDNDIDIDIPTEDLRIDTYRAGGAGGQHVNRTESAIRITHFPTGIVVTCQNSRSQHQNKTTAMNMLKARLLQIEIEKKRQEKLKLMGEQKDIAWGSQIRSYVFQPYTMVKDHRTNEETGNVEAVMDGDIDGFIERELLMFARIESE